MTTRAAVSVLFVALLTLFTGCVMPTDPALDEEEETDTPPPVSTVTEYTLSVTPTHIHVLKSCDGLMSQSGITDGEFQWRYEVTGAGRTQARESSNYGSPAGTKYSRGAGRTINIADRTFTWTSVGSKPRASVKFFGSEWDATGRDPRMRNDSATKSASFSNTSQRVYVGRGEDCRMYLQYTVRTSTREVPAA